MNIFQKLKHQIASLFNCPIESENHIVCPECCYLNDPTELTPEEITEDTEMIVTCENCHENFTVQILCNEKEQ